jgi:hypothetical protein
MERLERQRMAKTKPLDSAHSRVHLLNEAKLLSKDTGFLFGIVAFAAPSPGRYDCRAVKERQSHRPTSLIRFDSTPFRLSGFASREKRGRGAEKERRRVTT